MPGPEDLEGKEYPPYFHLVEADRVESFADAIGVGELRGEPPEAPPTYAAVFALAANRFLFEEDSVRPLLSRLIHGEQEFEWERPVVVGDRLNTTCRVERVRTRGGVWFVDTSTSTVDERGDEVVRGRSTFVLGGAE